MNKAVKIYDTTLRDGTQGTGIAFSSNDKIRIAQKLDDFGVDYIEGGWPGSNPKDVSFFVEAAKLEWTNAKIAAFGSTRRANLKVSEDAQVQLLLDANTPVITFFGKSWKLHVEKVLRTTAEENRNMVYDTTAYLKDKGKEVVYDAEHFFDGYKDDPEHAMGTLEAAKRGGADIVVLCDTNGGTLPHEVAEITEFVREQLLIPVGIHTHDDAGFGAANALASIRAGSVQVQGTMNGYGERIGNCNLTTLIPNLQLKMNMPVVPDLTRLHEVSQFVEELANVPHNPRAPFVGSTAFAHKGGMHVNAVQKLSESYEHIRPELVGNRQRISISELSGQSNVLMKAEELGHPLEKGSDTAIGLLQQVKEMEKEGYEFEAAEASFELLIRKALKTYKPLFELEEYRCMFHRIRPHDDADGFEACTATVKLKVDGQTQYTAADGDGPINALDGALRKALLPHYPQIADIKLTDYRVRISDSQLGSAAKTRVLIDSSDGNIEWSTVGVSFNIIRASWQALVDSVEYYLLKS
ncbi:MAG: 2-isopropylmalate synthase [Verrucomicrobiales bacterium]|jgi:2-isopropylmalate synthase